MSGRSSFRGAFWILVAVLFVAHVGGGWMYSNRIIDEAFTPNPGAVAVPEGEYELFQVTYDSPLGDMDAWYIPAPGTTWVIHIHGLNATPAEPEMLFEPLQQAGYQQLTIAYRNDESQPADPTGYHQYGVTEWEDVFGAVEFARDSGAQNVVLAGYGTGASHALSYVFRHNIDYVTGVVTDSANVDLGSTIDFRGSQEKLPLVPLNVPPTVAWVAKFFTSLRINVNWKSLDYVEKADRSLRIPVLAIHGNADDSIPIDQSIGLDEANTELVRFVEIDGAGHVDASETDSDRYLAEVLAFLSDVS